MTAKPGARRSGSSFAERLTPLLAAAGVTPLPTTLLRYQALLDLSPQALVLAAWVLSKKWSAEWPYLSLDEVAAGVGRDRAVVKSWKRELVRKGYLTTLPRYVPGVGRRADVWDLSGLFAQLERLYLREQALAALDKVRTDLPAPSFREAFGPSPLPTPSTGRRGKITPPRQEENTPPPGEEFAPAAGANSSRRARRKTPPEKEADPRTPSGETRPENPAPQKPGHSSGPPTQLPEEQRQRLLARLARDRPEEAARLQEIEARLRRRAAGGEGRAG